MPTQAAPPKDAVDKWLRIPRLRDDRDRFFTALMAINAAHVCMLHERELISTDMAQALLSAIQEVEGDPASLEAFSDREDLYFSVEDAIIALAGPDAGGQMHMGRSRNDIGATSTRMVARSALLRLQPLMLEVMSGLLALANEHVHTLMPGYTHLRPGQPTTFGHYLIGVTWALRRDYERLTAARRTLDASPMGAAAFAGTGFDIDRERVAELLGFSHPVPHTQDAVASRDALLETLAAMSLAATTLARWIQDWYIWSSLEFGMLSIDASIAGGSSIMPQKRNPNVLERVKAKSAHVATALLDALFATKGTGFMHCQDVSVESVAPFWYAATELEAMLEVSEQLARSVTVDVARMRERATSGSAMATEVADGIVRTRGIPFRVAHGIVKRATSESKNGDLATLVARLNATGAELDHPLAITQDEAEAWVDPETAVGRRHSGGPAPAEAQRHSTEIREWLRKAQQECALMEQQLTASKVTREAAIKRIMEGAA